MSNPADAPTLPSSADTWPPLPTSAPETIIIENKIVTVNGDHLRVEDLSRKWDWIISPITMFFVQGGFEAEEAYLSRGHLHFSYTKPFLHQWAFQSWHHYLAFLVFILFVSTAFAAFTSCARYRSLGSGISLFSRLTISVCRGRKSSQVASVSVPHMLRDERSYDVWCRLDRATASGFKVNILRFTFRQRENAVRFGQVLADFLNLPVVEV